MAAGHEIRREGEVDYSKPIHRSLLRDSRLSFAARGLFAFLWDLPDGWRANSTHLAAMSPQGREAVQTMLRELRAVGAMRDEAIIGDDGLFAGKRWILVSPVVWAVETHLLPNKSLEANEIEDRRVSRPSGSPTVGKHDTKVLLAKGSSNKSSSSDQDDLVAAARKLVRLENEKDELLFGALCSGPGPQVVIDEATALITAGKQPWLAAIKKIIDQKNKKAAARRQAEEAVRAPPARVKPETLAELRAAISGTRPAI